MNTNLLGEINKVKKQAKRLWFVPKISTTFDGDSVIFFNSKAERIVIMGMVEVSGREVLAAYKINSRKWFWAEKEGFTKEDIMSKKNLSSQVFTEISIDEIADSLV